jgi:hypothetical protein
MGTPKVFLEVEDLTDGQIKELPEWVAKLIDGRIMNGVQHTNGDEAVDL